MSYFIACIRYTWFGCVQKRKAAVAAAAAAAAKGASSSSSAPVEPEVSVAASERTKEDIKNWQQDPAEKARCIWEW